jgi:hypothetical protein
LVPRVLRLFLGEHAALSGADPGARKLRSPGEGHLGFLGERAEAHVRHEEGDVQRKGLLGAGADHEFRSHRGVVQLGDLPQLGGDQLDVVPLREIGGGHAHGGDGTVPAVGQSGGRQLLDEFVVRFLGGAVEVLVGTLVGIATKRLRIRQLPLVDLVLVDPHGVVLDPTGEPLKSLAVVVLADPGIEAVVPPVEAADEIGAVDVPVRQEGAPVEAPSVQDRHVVAMADDHQIHVADQRAGWLPVGELAPGGDLDALHMSPRECSRGT